MSEQNKKDELLNHGKINLNEKDDKESTLDNLNNIENNKQEQLSDEEKLNQYYESLKNDDENDELSDEEKREKLIKFLKESRIKFKNTVHNGNVTHTKFDTNYKKKRKKRNKLTKKSRKANRK
jgi:hypothetical protein